MRKLTARELRKMILQEAVRPMQRKRRRPLADFLFEQEAAEEATADYAAVTKATNIKDLGGAEAFKQLSSGDENAPLIQAMKDATSWSGGAIEGAGGAEAIKAWADEVGEADLVARIDKVGAALPSGAPPKKDMPALEGEDAEAVADALTPGGEYNIDITADFAGDQEDFDAWYDGLPAEEKKAYDAGKSPKVGEVKEESFLREDKWPRHGMDKMPGGGADAVGKALAFLTKGMADGDPSDDNIEVKTGSSLSNSKMIPTQSNILAAKSLVFAFLHQSPASETDLTDMGGAFVTSSGEILDGHHRWSGAYIGTGGGLDHNNVHVVKGDAEALIPMLTSVGNALGRTQKESRVRNEPDNLIMERWRRLAGLL